VKDEAKSLLTGIHFIDGDMACAEGAIAAGCRFVAGYPITPSTEVVERLANRFPQIGGIFIQMEDEIASSIAIQGGVWGGAKCMTVTSGPGMTLMMEHVGYAAMTETPCVFVNVQRGGPSTGLPTLPAQSDVMQARWGSHGDYRIIALSPNSPQEAFNLTIDCFNLAEQYRTPVFLLMDECVGHMLGKVVIPAASEIRTVPRWYTKRPPGEYRPYDAGTNDVPDMVKAGDGYKFHITGLTHNEIGYPVMTADTQEKLISRLIRKIDDHVDEIVRVDRNNLDDAEVVVVSYGITSRVAQFAIDQARKRKAKVGHLRLITIWPFPDAIIRSLAQNARAFVVPEINMGQIVHEVERAVAGRAAVRKVSHAGGAVHHPDAILDVIMEVAK